MTFALVTSESAQSSDDDTATTSAANTTGATLLVVSVCFWSNATEPVLTDSKSNTWIPLRLRKGSPGDGNLRMYYAINPTVGSGHTFTATGSADYPAISMLAFSGSKLVTPRDQENGFTWTSGTLTNIQTGSVTPVEDNELVITTIQPSGATADMAIDSGFTIQEGTYQDAGVAFGIFTAYKIQTTAGAENPEWSWTSTGAPAAGIVSFQELPASVNGKILLVAGGAGGSSGGGGAGGVVYDAEHQFTAGSYPVVIGAGGAGAATLGPPQSPNGSDSTFDSAIISLGGGGAGDVVNGVGIAGGCGGGGGASSTGTNLGGIGSQGGDGGSTAGFLSAPFPAAGGGGAGANGGDAVSDSIAGVGGAGTANSITGSSVTYAGGGGGACFNNGGTAGAGGAGGGGDGDAVGTGNPGTANTGGGGGGAAYAGGGGVGGNGGSGIAVISYLSASFTHSGGDATGTDGSYTWVKFTSSGTLTLTDVSGSQIKTINGLAIASVKTINGLAIASVKTRNGLANV